MSKLNVLSGALLIGGGLLYTYYDFDLLLSGCAKCWIKLLLNIIFVLTGIAVLTADLSRKEIPVAAGK